jgi:hypothetical protein
LGDILVQKKERRRAREQVERENLEGWAWRRFGRRNNYLKSSE